MYGEDIVELDAEFIPLASSFLGAPLRDMRNAYMENIKLIPGHSDASIFGNNEIIIKDERYRKGLLCTEGYYSPDQNISIGTGDLGFTGTEPSSGHDGYPTWLKLNGYIRVDLIPFVSIRCNLVGATTEIGDWYTPETPDDLFCRVRTDRVTTGSYSVQIDAIANILLSDVNTLTNSMMVELTPQIEAVSSRYIVDNVPIRVFGYGYPDNGAMTCRFSRTYMHDQSESILYSIAALFISKEGLGEYQCIPPNLDVRL